MSKAEEDVEERDMPLFLILGMAPALLFFGIPPTFSFFLMLEDEDDKEGADGVGESRAGGMLLLL